MNNQTETETDAPRQKVRKMVDLTKFLRRIKREQNTAMEDANSSREEKQHRTAANYEGRSFAYFMARQIAEEIAK